MSEVKDIEVLKEGLRKKFESLKSFVKDEYDRSISVKQPAISANCPEKLKPLAERLLAIQNEYGEIKPAYIDHKDYYKLKDMTKLKNKMTIRQAVSFMIDNAYYVDNDVVNARHILRMLTDFETIYNKYYEQYGYIPLSAFSKETQYFCKDLKSGLLKEDVIRTVLEVFVPEYANINMEHHDYSLIPRRPLKEEQIKQYVSELNSIYEKHGDLNVLFSPEYEQYLRKFCEKLKTAGYNFHTFIAEHTNLPYTMCFKCNDIVGATKKMCLSFKDKYETTKGIQSTDPYLWVKVIQAKEILGVFTIGEMMDRMGIDHDNYDTSKRTLTEAEIVNRENKFFKQLEELYPDRVIPANSIIQDEDLYGELLFLSKRRRFNDIGEYLSVKGFSREAVSNSKPGRTMFLSDRDIVNYDFLRGCETSEDVEKVFAGLDIQLADPVMYLGYYRKLAYEGIDSLAKSEYKPLVNKNMFRSLS